LKYLPDFANTALANQIYPDDFSWHYASKKFGQGYLRNCLSFAPKDIGAYCIYRVSDNEGCKPRGNISYRLQYNFKMVLKRTDLIELCGVHMVTELLFSLFLSLKDHAFTVELTSKI